MKNSIVLRSSKSGFFILALFGLSACGGPSTEQIKSFGDSTTKAAAVLSDSESLQNELRLQSSILHQTCHFIEGSQARIGQKATGPQNDVIKERAVFTRALLRYAQALALADDPQGVTELRESAASFSTELSGVIDNIPAPSPSSSATGPIINLVINGVVRLDELQRRRDILEIAREVDDYLFLIQRNILNDQDEVDRYLSIGLGEWKKNAQCVLNNLNSRDAESARLFMEFDSSLRGYSARVKSVMSSPRIFRTIVNAHNQMVENPDNFDRSIEEIRSVITELEDVSNALDS